MRKSSLLSEYQYLVVSLALFVVTKSTDRKLDVMISKFLLLSGRRCKCPARSILKRRVAYDGFQTLNDENQSAVLRMAYIALPFSVQTVPTRTTGFYDRPVIIYKRVLVRAHNL